MRTMLRAAALAGALATLPHATLARDGGAPAPCREGATVTIWTSPRAPTPGTGLRVLAVADEGPLDDLRIHAPDGGVVTTRLTRRGGPPWSLAAELPALAAGAYRVEAVRSERETMQPVSGTAPEPVACRRIEVAAGHRRPEAPGGHRSWSPVTEAFFSAWIEHLFDAPPDAALDFDGLYEVLQDPGRNFLHDHFGLGEDDAGSRAALTLTPDCADLPYVLRAYFAWKLGLPFGYRSCGRGTRAAPPRCGPVTVRRVSSSGAEALPAFKREMHRLFDAVHSGNARTALADDATDFYPVPLTRDALRPGVVYADPYGHLLVLVKWVPQTAERGGLLLAVDAQPDNSVGRKRFWEGTFLFADDVASAGPGFKAFRPLGAGAAPANAELRSDGATPYSDEQARLSPDAFYARMARLINPDGLEPARAYEETLAALVEQLETRVGSVENGERYKREHPGAVVPMPAGAAIFETVGPWEDYSTPSRDMRLLIAMTVLTDLPARIVRHPELFELGAALPEDARAAVEALHARRAGEVGLEYTRSDGSPQRLTVADLLARRRAFEVAYNPNDCVEIRWGAAEGSAEHATCRRRAPDAQRARMAEYRDWFRETRRPSR